MALKIYGNNMTSHHLQYLPTVLSWRRQRCTLNYKHLQTFGPIKRSRTVIEQYSDNFSLDNL